MLKECCPLKDTNIVEGINKDMVVKVDSKMKGELSKILEEYGDIFPEKLLFGQPTWHVVDHDIEVVLNSIPRTKPI